MRKDKPAIEAPLPPFAFCESVAAGSTGRWYLRKIDPAIGLKTGGGIDTSALCGHPSKSWGWDLATPITEPLLRDHACPLCVTAYRLGIDALHTVVDVFTIKGRGFAVVFAPETRPFTMGDVLSRGRYCWAVKGEAMMSTGYKVAHPVLLLAIDTTAPGVSSPLATSLTNKASWPRVGDVLARLGPATTSR